MAPEINERALMLRKMAEQARARREARAGDPGLTDRVEEQEARLDEQSAKLAALTLSISRAHAIADGDTEPQRHLRLVRDDEAS